VNGSSPSDTLNALRNAGAHPILRTFPEGVIIVFDHDLRYICAGGHGLSTVGLSQETIEGKTIFEVFPPEVSSVLEEPYRQALNGHEAAMDITFGARTYLHRVAPVTESDGSIVAGIGFAFEVTEARGAERALRESEENLRDERRRLRDAESIGNSGSWEWDTVTDVITWSDGLFALHGLDRKTFDGGYAEAASRVHPDDRGTVDQAIEGCRRNGSVRFRYRIARASDGEMRWFDSRCSGVFEDGKLVRLLGTVADVTEQVVAEAEVAEATAFQQAVIAASPDYTFISNLETGAFVYGSRDRDMLGRSAEQTEAMGPAVIEALVHPEDQPTLRALNARACELMDGEVLQVRYRLRHVDGQWHWFSRHVVPFRRDKDGNVVEVLGVLRDITDVVRAEERLAHDALHDALTGLPNRALLLDRLGAALARSARDGSHVAVLFCDLDGFKHVNDTAGHAAGDAVLRETAKRLRGALRAGDTVARVGGDEFVILVEAWKRSGPTAARREGTEDADGRTLTLLLADRIVGAIREPFTVQGIDHEISVSIGVSYPSPSALRTADADGVIKEADDAMYAAKHHGKNRVEVFAGRSDPT
jgi:diguanylate cyclase (GGDEF)-like protein/PAS domain S-box-containing protein